jgi:hypothetical protein
MPCPYPSKLVPLEYMLCPFRSAIPLLEEKAQFQNKDVLVTSGTIEKCEVHIL